MSNLNVFGSGGDDPRLEELRVERTGIVVGALRRQRPEPEMPTNLDWLAVEVAPVLPGYAVPCVNVYRRWSNAYGHYFYIYEGVPPGHRTRFIREFAGEMGESPIKAHPDFASLRKKYGWSEASQDFPEFMPGNGGGGGLKSGPKEGPKPSPMAGVRAWLTPRGSYSVTFAQSSANRVPSWVFAKVGEVVKPPGIERVVSSASLKERNWLKLMPVIRERGNAFEITMPFLMSGLNKWNPDVYKAVTGAGSPEPSASDKIEAAWGWPT